jgi:hypothetical protein
MAHPVPSFFFLRTIELPPPRHAPLCVTLPRSDGDELKFRPAAFTLLH